MNVVTIILYIVSGLASGIIGGLGMGGGTILIPLLTIFLKMPQKMAQGINLLSFLMMAIFSLFIHNKNGYLKTKNIWLLIIPGIFFSAFGSYLASIVSGKLLKKLFGGFLCVLAIIEFFKVLKFTKLNKNDKKTLKKQ